jgi:two-component system response regulator RstA
LVSDDEHGRLLLVEDDLRLAAVIREFLEKRGYAVATEHRGDRAVDAIAEHDPDLVILDLMLPGKDGLTVCREARTMYHRPILILTARGAELDEVLGLELGADDYLAKPLRPQVLLARIRALLRRSRRAAEEPKRLEIGQLVINVAARTVEVAGSPVDLTTAEFDLLWCLATHAGRALTRDELSRITRGISHDGVDRSIDLRISSLRAKLGDDGKRPALIKSIRGVGYQLAVES